MKGHAPGENPLEHRENKHKSTEESSRAEDQTQRKYHRRHFVALSVFRLDIKPQIKKQISNLLSLFTF